MKTLPFDLLNEIEKAKSALRHIDPSCDRDTWVRVGMSLHVLGDAGRALWIQWSQESDKYDERMAEATWRSFHDGTHGVGIATLYHMAKQAGWDSRSSDSGEIRPIKRHDMEPRAQKTKQSRPSVTYVSIEEAAQAIVARLKRDERFEGCDDYRTTIYPYHASDGTTVTAAIRVDYYNRENKPAKEFRQIRSVDGGYALGGLEGKRPLYRLEQVAKTHTVFICEGEKAADALNSLFDSLADRPDYIATTSMQGAQSPGKTDWFPLKGKTVFIWPDNDEPGAKYASIVASLLAGMPPPPEVRLLHVNGLPQKGDAYDWIESFGEAAEPEVIMSALLGLLDEATRIEAVAIDDENKIRYAAIGLRELLAFDDKIDYLIPGIMVANENMVIGAAEKTLKSSIGMDLTLSLASGTPFLGEFAIPRAVSAGIMSGESGKKSLANLAHRIVAARNIDIDLANQNFIFTSDLPELDDGEHAAALLRFVEMHKLRVLLIDPMYLCFESTSDDANNAKKIGPLLRRIAEPCQHIGCTIVLVEHALRIPPTGQALTIQQLPTTASKFARQFMLLSRREEYQDNGQHDLWMRVGGSAGHSGCWGVRIDEGTLETGRKWEVSVLDRTEAMKASKAARAQAQAQRRDRQAAEDIKSAHSDIMAAFRSLGGKPETKAKLTALSGHRGKAFDKALAELLRTKRVVATTITKSNGHRYQAYALASGVPQNH